MKNLQQQADYRYDSDEGYLNLNGDEDDGSGDDEEKKLLVEL